LRGFFWVCVLKSLGINEVCFRDVRLVPFLMVSTIQSLISLALFFLPTPCLRCQLGLWLFCFSSTAFSNAGTDGSINPPHRWSLFGIASAPLLDYYPGHCWLPAGALTDFSVAMLSLDFSFLTPQIPQRLFEPSPPCSTLLFLPVEMGLSPFVF